MQKKSLFLTIVLLLFSATILNAIEVSFENPEEDVLWTFETTSGIQNLRNVLVSSTKDKTVSQLLNFKGILFNSYHNKIQRVKSKLNLGFTQKSKFMWTDLPDFVHENDLTYNLRCIEFDTQFMYPIRIKYDFSLSPFLGYSFFDYSYNESFSGINSETYKYSSFLFGLRFQMLFTKAFINSLYFSYSPIVFENNKKTPIQFFNYGVEIKTNTHPLSLTFFASMRNAWQQRKILIFEGMKGKFDTSEIGFALHLNVRD